MINLSYPKTTLLPGSHLRAVRSSQGDMSSIVDIVMEVHASGTNLLKTSLLHPGPFVSNLSDSDHVFPSIMLALSTRLFDILSTSFMMVAKGIWDGTSPAAPWLETPFHVILTSSTTRSRHPGRSHTSRHSGTFR